MEKILIVDDEEAIRILYSDEFMEEGYEVIAVAEASRVMESIEKEGPDLVILDVRLGRCDGIDVFREIRNTYYDMPVILCTAYLNFKSDTKSIAAPDYFVVKSSNLEELKRKVRGALDGEMQTSPPPPHDAAPMDQMAIL